MGAEHVIVDLLAGEQLGNDVAHLLADLEQADRALFGEAD
jgi:hypothetical protein